MLTALTAEANKANSIILCNRDGGRVPSTRIRQLVWSCRAFAGLGGALEMLFALV